MERRSRGAAASLLAAALAAGALVAVPTGTASAAPSPLSPGKSWKVTLLTGDVVTVRTVKGRPPLVTTQAGPGRKNRSFRTSLRPDGHVVVTPGDVAGLVGKVLDPALFDVTALIKQGYDDARSRELPLIVQRAKGVRSAAALGLREGRELPSIGAVAARQPKGQAFRTGTALSARSGAGLQHVWLDRKVKASVLPKAAAPKLDRNLTQVRAPEAWKAGNTGRGVKVAVLDTGVDAAHPDLRGRVAESMNFSEAPDVTDRFGHGTHVAATVAGTGAASGGARRGVAPDASLLVGKVLGDDGYGSESMLIAGMEWAAPRAKIVNMSLGGDTTDGTDPLAKALDELSAKHGTLFVAAAGNTGPFGLPETPGSADSALTVGAVDSADRLAEFSSRGPRGGRPAAKPEIVAPGVDIVAARAKGTAMGEVQDADYTSASGTSMATPHVAGAAALLAQKHPKWTAAQLKAALVGAADPVEGDAYERGSGRLNAAPGALLSLQAAPHLGTSAYPKHPALTTQLGWTSQGKAVNAALSVRVVDRTGKTFAGAAKLSATTVNVPAGGTANATLTVTPTKLKPGFYTAEVVAKGGGNTARTPVTFHVEPPSHTLTLVAKPLPNTPADQFSADAGVANIDDFALFGKRVDATPEGTKIRVPRGRYSVIGAIYDWSRESFQSALGGVPELVVDRDRTVVLDGTAAKQPVVGVEGVKTQNTMLIIGVEQTVRQGMLAESVYTGDPAKEKVFALPMAKPGTGKFAANLSSRQVAPDAVYDSIHPLGSSLPAVPTHVITPAERARMARVDQRFAAFDGDTTKPVIEKRYGLTSSGLLLGGFEASSEVPSGTTRTDYLTPGVWGDEAFPKAIDNGDWVDQLPFTERKPGTSVSYTWGRQPLRPGPVSGQGIQQSGCASLPTTRAPGSLHVELVDLQARLDGFDCGYEDWDVPDPFKRKLTLHEGGQQLGEVAANRADFTLPKRAGTFRLTYENDANGYVELSDRTSTAWTFRSAPGQTRVPLLLVDYDLALDLKGVPTGRPATFDVARVAGSAAAKVTGLKAWTSLDGGKSWQAAKVDGEDGRYTATLPTVARGQSLSVRVAATDDGGSAIDQTIMNAYRVK